MILAAAALILGATGIVIVIAERRGLIHFVDDDGVAEVNLILIALAVALGALTVAAAYIADDNTASTTRPAASPTPTPTTSEAGAATATPASPQPRPTERRAISHTPPTRASRDHVRAPIHVAGERLELVVTGYCATGNPTASGKWPERGMAAGNRWAFGTRIDIGELADTYGLPDVVTITDRIGHGSDLDLYLGAGASCEQAAARLGNDVHVVEVLS